MCTRKRTAGVYVFNEYVQRLKSLFQQNQTNISFIEKARLVSMVSRNLSRNYALFTSLEAIGILFLLVQHINIQDKLCSYMPNLQKLYNVL